MTLYAYFYNKTATTGTIEHDGPCLCTTRSEQHTLSDKWRPFFFRPGHSDHSFHFLHTSGFLQQNRASAPLFNGGRRPIDSSVPSQRPPTQQVFVAIRNRATTADHSKPSFYLLLSCHLHVFTQQQQVDAATILTNLLLRDVPPPNPLPSHTHTPSSAFACPPFEDAPAALVAPLDAPAREEGREMGLVVGASGRSAK